MTAEHEVLAFEDVSTPTGNLPTCRTQRNESSRSVVSGSSITCFHGPNLRWIVTDSLV